MTPKDMRFVQELRAMKVVVQSKMVRDNNG
jgi:hypothetical protein